MKKTIKMSQSQLCEVIKSTISKLLEANTSEPEQEYDFTHFQPLAPEVAQYFVDFITKYIKCGRVHTEIDVCIDDNYPEILLYYDCGIKKQNGEYDYLMYEKALNTIGSIEDMIYHISRMIFRCNSIYNDLQCCVCGDNKDKLATMWRICPNYDDYLKFKGGRKQR